MQINITYAKKFFKISITQLQFVKQLESLRKLFQPQIVGRCVTIAHCEFKMLPAKGTLRFIYLHYNAIAV